MIRRRWTAQRAAAELRRYAMTYTTVFARLLVVCAIFVVPQVSWAQSCEWDRFPEPAANTDVIEVLRHGGYGPPPFAGRTLVSLDASGRVLLLRLGQCPDRTLVGRLEAPAFAELVDEMRAAMESVRNQPPRPIVSRAEIFREGRMEPLCTSPTDGIDVDVTLYLHGSKEHYQCVTGALLRFGERVLKLVSDAI